MPLSTDDKNPYDSNTPEWQLFENAIGALRLECAYLNDVTRYQGMAKAAREKAALYQAALDKLRE